MNSKLTDFFKKRMYYIIGLLIVVLVVFAGISFAFFTQVIKSENDVVVKTGDLVITFNNGDTISGDFVPTSDDIGMTLDGYTFKVKNDGTLNASYKIELYADSSVEGTHIPHEYLMVSIDGEPAKQLSTFTKSTTSENELENVYLIGEGTVDKTLESTHVIRVWIKTDAPNTIIGNKVALKVKVTSEVNKTNPSVAEPTEVTN